jgi:hypothetical protein
MTRLPGQCGSQRQVSSRYSVLTAGREVRRILARLGRGSQRRVALEVGLNEQQMSAKLRGETDRFTVEQLGQIANVLDAPAGWPWVPWEERELLRREEKLVRLHTKGMVSEAVFERQQAEVAKLRQGGCHARQDRVRAREPGQGRAGPPRALVARPVVRARGDRCRAQFFRQSACSPPAHPPAWAGSRAGRCAPAPPAAQ